MATPRQRDVAKQQWTAFVRARDHGHVEYQHRAAEQNRYYCSQQWDEEDLAELRESGRPALTLNLTTTTVNTILGEQISRRAQTVFKPRRGGDQELADVLTKIHQQIMEANRYEWVEQAVFEDSIVMDGRGWFDVRVSFEDHWYGEVSVESVDPLDVVIDPDARGDDPKEWGEVYRMRWLTLDEIRVSYGRGKANQVKRMGDIGFEWGSDIDVFRREQTFGGYEGMPVQAELEGVPQDENRIRLYLVVERQYRKPSRVSVFLDPERGDERVAPNSWSASKIAEHAEENGLVVFDRIVRRVRWTVTCGMVVLHDEWSPYDDFTLIPCFAFFRPGHPFGPIRLIMSPQDMVNKTASQILHIVNSMANSGWMVPEDSLVDMEPEDLEEQGAKTGLVIVHKKGDDMKPDKIQPNQIPQGLQQIFGDQMAMLKEVSGVSDALRGTPHPRVSGVALENQSARGSVMMQIPLANLAKARQRVAERVLNLVQTFYTEERIVLVTNEDEPEKPREEIVVNRPTPQHRIANDLTIGEYDAIVTTAPARDTFDEMQFAEALSLLSVGVPIPPDVVVEYSHLAQKHRIARRIRQQMGAEMTPEQAEAARIEAELQLKGAQLALEEQAATVERIRADTRLSIAKGQSEADKSGIDLAREEAKLVVAQKNYDLRVALAELSADTQLEVSRNAAAGKVASQAMSGETQERIARISAAARPAAKGD